MLKNIKKIASFLILQVLLLVNFIIPIGSIYAATTTVEYYGPVSYNGSMVGRFYVNGKLSFCIDHAKTSPITGTEVESDIYDDDNILKCLYYGWEGAEPYSFGSEEEGIVKTTLALDHFKNGNTNANASDFINYVNSMPTPEVNLYFSSNNLTAYKEGNIQKTPTISVVGSSSYYLTIDLQNNVTLVNETKGTSSTGTANIYGGDSFHLEAPLTVTGSWTSSDINNHMYKYKAIVYRTQSATNQDLASGYTVVEDNTSTINLSVNWLETGSLKIVKVDSRDNTTPIEGVIFEIWNTELNEKVTTATTDAKGVIEVNNLSIGIYKALEIEANKWYELDNSGKTIEVKSNETTTLVVSNNIKTGYIEIIKQDQDYSDIKLEGAKFEITNSDGVLIETLTTDSSGYAKSKALPIDKTYTVKEVETDSNYIITLSELTVRFNSTDSGKIETLTVGNKRKTGNLRIFKLDKDNNKIVLGNVEFDLYSYEFDKVIGTYYTNADGEIEINNLRVGEYSLIEKSTNKWYNLTEPIDVKINYNETTFLNIENELKKSQVQVTKVDEEDNEIKISGVSFEVLDENNNVLEIITTNEDGIATTKTYSVRDYDYLYLREVTTNENYLLNEEIQKVELKENEIINITIENRKIKGQIEIIKTAEYDNKILGTKAGDPIANVAFDIYDENKNYIETIVTGEDGKAITSLLNKGIKYIKEYGKTEWFLLNTTEYVAEITNDGEIVQVEITNIPEKPEVDVEKEGVDIAEKNEEICYSFQIKNTGNVALENFTWYDYIPTEYVKISKLETGTYSEELNYSIYYKTNLNDYKLLAENLNTKENNYINFDDVELEEDEVITEIKAKFETVDVGFENVDTPYIYVIVNENVQKDDTFTNVTRLEGYNDTYLVYDESEYTTTVYEEEVVEEPEPLPRTGR